MFYFSVIKGSFAKVHSREISQKGSFAKVYSLNFANFRLTKVSPAKVSSLKVSEQQIMLRDKTERDVLILNNDKNNNDNNIIQLPPSLQARAT